MNYAEIAVTCRTSRGSGSFHYSLPPGLEPEPGSLVWVPFGQRLVQGIVFSLSDEAPPFPTKDVFSVADTRPILTVPQLHLARWLANHYTCALSAVVAQMLPAELRQKATPVYARVPGPLPTTLRPAEEAITAELSAAPLKLVELERRLPGTDLKRNLRALVLLELVTTSWIVEQAKVKPRTERTVRVALLPEAAAAAVEALRRARSQSAALRWLVQHADDGHSVRLPEAVAGSGVSQAAFTALSRHGYVVIEEREVLRSPLTPADLRRVPLPSLTPAQITVLRAVVGALRERVSRAFLLHGVTGSGKGEVYLHALAETLRLGLQAIVLVPEIALTPQTIRRFASRFGGGVAVLHSRLSGGEHYDEWRRIRAGDAAIVIGSRSAIFAPLERVGLIVVDEEHEWSYKQAEKEPRYHAREAALALGEICGAPVLLGSATPDVATYHRASTTKEFALLELPERVEGGRPLPAASRTERAAPPPTIPMPEVKVVDLRSEEKAGNRSLFSRSLRRAIAQALDEQSQVILYINRRGTATFVVCRICGYVARCRRCDVPLVFHADRNQLLCHQCNRATPTPHMCPACWSRQIGYFGSGTERVEAEAKRLFPDARVVRWDRDTARGKAAHRRMLDKFLGGEADIMVGTQMIAKGLDLPDVALVGVVVADTALQLPDFRAAERTFQLLMQVGGRAGRGARPGRVLIQTYNPDHYVIRAVASHDYGDFYRQEIRFRAEHAYPPFGNLARLVYYNSSEARCRRETERLAAQFRDEIERRGLPDLDVIGPAPAFHRRLRGRFRWHLLLRGGEVRDLLGGLTLPPGWAVDVDPISLL